MDISAKARQISTTALRKVKEFGAVLTLNSVIEVSGTPSTPQDRYADFYKQTKNETPSYDKGNQYTLHGLIDYNPSVEKLRGAGLDNSCDVMITIVTLETIESGLIDEVNDNIPDVVDKLKLKKVIELNGRKYTIDNVNFESHYKQFPITLVLICNAYK